MNKKKIKSISLALGALTTMTIGSTIPLIVQQNDNKLSTKTLSSKGIFNSLYCNNFNDKNKTYVYDHKKFDKMEDVVEYATKGKEVIKHDVYMGNVTNAISDHTYNMVDISKLRLFTGNNDRFKPAYKGITCGYEHDINQIKKSYTNSNLIKYKYDDLNGQLFDSYSEAKESMINKTKTTPVTYQWLKIDDKKYKFNPFNIKDVNELKIIALKNALLQKNNFALKIYTKDKDSLFSNCDRYLFNDKNIWNNIIKKFMKIFLISWNNFFHKHAVFNAKLNICGTGAWAYKFQNFKTKEKNHRIKNNLLNNHCIEYKNLHYDELSKFNAFLSLNKFNEHFYKWIHKWGLNWVAEEACTKNNILNSDFEIRFCGNRWGFCEGIDFKILDEGTSFNRPEMDLNVHITLANKEELEEKAEEYFDFNSLIDIYGNELSYDNNTSFVKKLLKNIWNYLINKFKDAFLNLISDKTFYKDNEIIIPQSTNEFNNHINWKKASYINNACFIYQKNELFLSDRLFSYMNLNEIIWNTSNWFKYIIEYNNYPLFGVMVDLKTLIDTDWWFKDEKNATYKDGVFKAKKELNEKFNNLNNENKQFIIDNLINISQSYEVKNDNIIMRYNNEDDVEIFNSELDKYNDHFIKWKNEKNIDNIFAPILTNNENVAYDFNNALAAYNNALKNIIKSNKNKINDEIKSNQAKIEDIVILRNDNNFILNFFYGEYFANKNHFNPSLLNSNENIEIYYNPNKIKEIIRQNITTKPAKLVYLYDLNNNLLNDVYDTVHNDENEIIDNVLRTKIIRNDPDKTFYLEDDNKTYKLLDRSINKVYSLEWNDKKYYFLTHQAAVEYLYLAIKMDTIEMS